MGMILWGASPLCETGSLKELRILNDNSDRQSTRRWQLRWGDPGWGGSRSQSCEATRQGNVVVARQITVVLDNARYQRNKAVMALADTLGIELLYLPAVDSGQELSHFSGMAGGG
jgi:hypothetical protein